MADKLVLITGATGHVGFAVLKEALKKGFKVRVSVRRDSSISDIKATKSIQPHLAQIEFVIVQDITKAGAFDKALIGVSHVIHVASPLGQPSDDSKDLEEHYITPAIQGTLSILHSARGHPSIKRIVITSSAVAILPLSTFMQDTDETFTADSPVQRPSGPYPMWFAAYAASKQLAYAATVGFINNKDLQLHFDIINIMPTFVIGANELATTPSAVSVGSNHLALDPILGSQNPDGMPGFIVHLDDVAYLHVAALNPKIPGNQAFAANYKGLEGIVWDDGKKIVEKHFPDEIKKGVFPTNGHLKTKKIIKFDASKTEEVFGIKFRSYEDALIDLVGWYAKVATDVKA